MDKLKAMATFVAIADGGSLTAAAKAQGGSLPAVVRTLAALEAELGTRLLHRTTRKIALTDEGRRYVERCRKVLMAVADADDELHADRTEPRGRLTVTAPVLFGQLHVCGAITTFLQRHPKVQVDVRLHDHVVSLVDEGIDVGIRIGPIHDESLVAKKVGGHRPVVVASPDYLARHGTPRRPDELVSHNCLRFSNARGAGWPFVVDGEPVSVEVSGNLTINQVAPLTDACAAGLGVGLFMSYQVAAHMKRGALRVVLEDFSPAERPIHIVYPRAPQRPARVTAFVDWMRRSLAKPAVG
jgi:DNA-binding transcriptional LysR family regulator